MPTDPRLARAAEYAALAEHNIGESDKLRGKRERVLAHLRRQAEQQFATRPTVSHTVESILDSLARGNPRLEEYGAGLQIVERRATMYAAMATELRMQVMSERLNT